MPGIEFGPRAQEELRRILDDLDQHSQEAGAGVAAQIQRTGDLLAQYPRMGRLEYPEAALEYRSVVSGSYLMWYRVTLDDLVTVLAIRHGRRRPPTLQELEERTGQPP